MGSHGNVHTGSMRQRHRVWQALRGAYIPLYKRHIPTTPRVLCEIGQDNRKTGVSDFAACAGCATLNSVNVVLRKVGRSPGRAVFGRLLQPPRAGTVVVIEFPDGLHEYVTTPVKRVLRLAGGDVYYLQTSNSRYRMEVRSPQTSFKETTAITSSSRKD